MNILTIYAHPSSRSFCHAILEEFSRGLVEAGHTNEVVDLYAMHFNPVFTRRDYPAWVDEKFPLDALKNMILESSGGPMQRFLLKPWLRNKDAATLVKFIRKFKPGDVIEQQKKITRAQGLAILFPVWFVGMPAILKGWIERVFTYSFAYSLNPEGWQGDIKGRVPLLRHEKALLISTTLFDEQAYNDGLRDAMTRLIDDFGFRYPGIKNVEHVYFYSVGAVGEKGRQEYLRRAYQLGKDYSQVGRQ
jgi:NAD(P)H dehydrogenase (quinone)